MRLTLSRLRAVSLFSWSVEQNAPDTQMTTRVTEGSRPETHAPSFLSSPLNARSRARALRLLNLKKKTDCSQSILFPNMPANPIISQICIFVTSPFSSSQFLPLKMETLLHCGHYSLSQGCQAYRIPFSIIWTPLYCGRFFWSQQC